MTDNMNNFPIKLKEVRLKLGLTQLEVANALGITQSYYNRIENAKVTPPPPRILRKKLFTFWAQVLRMLLNSSFR